MILLLALAFAEPALDDAITNELERSQQLKLDEAPALYHQRYQLLLLEQVDAVASFGSLIQTSRNPYRAAAVELRIGKPEFDNTGFGGWQDGFARAPLPIELTPDALQKRLWRLTDKAYKEAVEQYARKTSQFSPPPEYPGDYTMTGKVMFDAEAAPPPKNPDALVERAVALSKVLAVDGLLRGEVHLGHESGAIWTFDSEGSRVKRPIQETSIRAVVHARAEDGLLLTDAHLWSERKPNALPSREEMEAVVVELRDGLLAAASAKQMSEEYVGPVVFEEGAAIDLFRYVLTPQLLGTPAEIPFDSWFGELGNSKDSVRLGRRVLPPGWRVEDDPTRDPKHPGSYTHDLEGTPAETVVAVEEGIVRDLMMSRVPRKGVKGTNGHGRGIVGSRAEGATSLLEISAPKQVSSAKLRKTALKAAKSYGRDHILVVKRLQDAGIRTLELGWSFGEENGSKLPSPVSVWKVYADGREEQLRGAGFANVQRWVLRDIVAAGPSVEASYLDPPGGRPTSGRVNWMRAPSVLVGEVELVPTPGDPMESPLLEAPAAP